MTVLEEYKMDVDSLINKLDDMSFGFSDVNDARHLMMEAANKLTEMMGIIVNVGIANGAMASALQIMTEDKR